MAARPAWMDAPTREDGTPLDPRWHTLVVLPTDYDDFGGDVVRWDDPQESDPDCSCGCVHFRERDGDWGVCKRTDAPRYGLLTWEHMSGRGCFETAWMRKERKRAAGVEITIREGAD